MLTDAANMPTTALRNAVSYEEWLGEADEDFAWQHFDENTAATCAQSGTTGEPKGVLYSHRSNLLLSLAVNNPDFLGLSSRDVAMPVVPLFHAMAGPSPFRRRWRAQASCCRARSSTDRRSTNSSRPAGSRSRPRPDRLVRSASASREDGRASYEPSSIVIGGSAAPR